MMEFLKTFVILSILFFQYAFACTFNSDCASDAVCLNSICRYSGIDSTTRNYVAAYNLTAIIIACVSVGIFLIGLLVVCCWFMGCCCFRNRVLPPGLRRFDRKANKNQASYSSAPQPQQNQQPYYYPPQQTGQYAAPYPPQGYYSAPQEAPRSEAK